MAPWWCWAGCASRQYKAGQRTRPSTRTKEHAAACAPPSFTGRVGDVDVVMKVVPLLGSLQLACLLLPFDPGARSGVCGGLHRLLSPRRLGGLWHGNVGGCVVGRGGGGERRGCCLPLKPVRTLSVPLCHMHEQGEQRLGAHTARAGKQCYGNQNRCKQDA